MSTPNEHIAAGFERPNATPKPTHSAQEAAELRAKVREEVFQACNSASALGRLTDIIEDATDKILRHFPSTPTQSQQPPSLREAIAEAVSQICGGPQRTEVQAVDRILAAITPFLALPATPPLPSGAMFSPDLLARCVMGDSECQIFKTEARKTVLRDEESGSIVTAYIHPDGRILMDSIRPPLPSIGDGKDGGFDQWWATHCYEVRDTVEGHPRHPAMNQSERLKEGARIVWRARQ